MNERKAFLGNSPHVRVRPEEMVCVHRDCQASPHPELMSPLCMDHAKKLTVQVMLLTSTTLQPMSQKMSNRQINKLAPKKESREKPGLVYFIRFGDRIKIGYTTHVENRMKNLPHDEILAVIPGTMDTEREHHKRFDDIRITGEWFDNDPRLTDYIKTLPKYEPAAA